MMNLKTLAGTAGIAAFALAVTAPAWSQAPKMSEADKKARAVFAQDPPAGATVLLKDTKGKSVGLIELKTAPSGMTLSARLTGLPPGVHAFHIHEKGVCKGDFATAGGHFNPSHAKHGIMNEGGRHAGDLPNIEVPASGAVNLDLFLTGVSMSPGSPINLNDNDGSSFVIHAGPDDYKTDPAGNAGGRIACGVMEVKKAAAAPAKPAAPK